MNKSFQYYTMLFTTMFLILATSAGAFSVGDVEAIPECLTRTGLDRIQASIGRERYWLHLDSHTRSYQAHNAANGFDVTFTRQGVEVRPQKVRKAWRWGLRFTGDGYGSELRTPSGAVELISKGNRIEYHHGDIVEWYVNDHRGLEQGFTLSSRPPSRLDSGPLQVHISTTGNLEPEVEKDGKGIVWKDAQGNEVLRYSGLYARDATGRWLSARMAADQEGLRLIVADHGATYPITIDPFIQKKKITASDGAAIDWFGYSVSISGDTAIVGAYGDCDTGITSGSAYIFFRDHGGTDNWGEVEKLTASDRAAVDSFGYSVSISGDTAVVGARYDDDKGSNSGSAYIFFRDHGGTDNWGEVEKLTASDGAEGENFGSSVSISGDTAIVGAKYDDDKGSESGSAYIFSRNHGGTDNWGEVKKLTASDGAAIDHFGISVSINEDTAIVGAEWDDDKGISSGSAYIFSRNHGGTDNWGEVKKLTASDGAAKDFFGISVSISGDTTIVGAYGDDDKGGNSGSAYIFSRNQGGVNNWGLVRELTAADGAASDHFGISVSISGDTSIVGARYDDDKGDMSGSANIFFRNHGGTDNWGEVEKLTASDGASVDNFGESVSISGDTAIVGARYDDDKGSNSGSAYIFEELPQNIFFPIKSESGKTAIIYLE
jgi:FG-GAP repeat